MRNVNYMCPNCFNIVDIKRTEDARDYEYSIADFYQEYSVGKDVDNIKISTDLPLMNISCNCKKCNNNVSLIELDEGISGIVQALNLKGYYTIYSCEGHIIDEENFDKAYIIFEVSDKADDIFFFNRIYRNFPSVYWIINRKFNIHNGSSTVAIYMRDFYACHEERRLEALKALESYVMEIPSLDNFMED